MAKILTDASVTVELSTEEFNLVVRALRYPGSGNYIGIINQAKMTAIAAELDPDRKVS